MHDNDYFMQVYTVDLIPHQDDATTGEEVFEGVIELVRWYAAEAPEDNVVDECDVPAYIEWLENERPELITIAQDSINAWNDFVAEGA